MKHCKYYIVLLFVVFQHCETPTNTVKNNIVPFNAHNGSWLSINSPITKDLIDVFFINSNTGWAISYSSVIKTIDGGNNWEIKKEINAPPYLYSIQFIDELIGWVGVSDTLILKTTDGGDNWTEITIPERGHEQIFFLNENTGWTGGWGTGIFKTSDAGLTWTKQLDIGEWERIQDIFFINDSLGWTSCLYYFCDSVFGSIVVNGSVYKTIDGGKNWLKSAIINNAFRISTIKFFDPLNGVFNCNEVLTTNNGGDSWINTNSLSSTNMHFINKNYGWIVGIYTNETGFVIGVTTDGGKSWNYMKDVVKDVDHDLEAVFFYDIYTGWAVGRNGTIMKYYPPAK